MASIITTMPALHATDALLPFDLAGQWIDRFQAAALLRIKHQWELDAEERITGLQVSDLVRRKRLIVHAHIECVDIDEPTGRIERHRRPVLAAGD